MIRVLFVCMGNICRSPAGEGVFRHFVAQQGLSDVIECESAGTIDAHCGERADSRMIKAAQARGYKLEGRARHFQTSDFERFHYIVVMDRVNFQIVLGHAETEAHLRKASMMGDFHPDEDVEEIPDPYYGATSGFELVLDLLEVSCRNLLDRIIREHGLKGSQSKDSGA